jgi:hypothetical protein
LELLFGRGPLIIHSLSRLAEKTGLDQVDNYFEDTPLLWKLRRKISHLIEPVLLTEDMNNPLHCDITKTGILI